ncbi:MAG: recombinase RecT [Thermoanaerobacterium sp.]|nr:recombinase RecT [Thermoanaerobacterium sp.]
MSNSKAIDNYQRIKFLLSNVNVKKRFEEVLGHRAAQFITSISNIVNGNPMLRNCDANSILSAAMVAATLDLPVDPNLGFSYIIPYHTKEGWKAQFQVGYKGIIQLALRTGQYKNINVIAIYEGQLKGFNPLTEEIELNFDNKISNKVIGYAAYFRLINGFEKTVYWPIEKVRAHAQRFSKTYNNGPWKTDFDEMAKKTVIKNTLSKWGILSVDMQTALKSDQAIIHESKRGVDYEYVDNPEPDAEGNNNVIDVNTGEIIEDDKSDNDYAIEEDENQQMEIDEEDLPEFLQDVEEDQK